MMSLTKEMMMSVERDIKMFDSVELLIYYHTHKNLDKNHPNSYDRYKTEMSFEEIYERGLEDKINDYSKYW